jgi:endonuclease V-like protein UPF0215 family
MPRSVICISRTTGASGEEVAHQVAEGLGFRYVDDEIIIEAAQRAGVSQTAIAEAEQSPSLINRILEAMATVPAMSAGGGGYVVPIRTDGMEYSQLIESVIRRTAQQGKVVIVAHGASIPLADTPNVLRVLVTASPAVRVKRLAGEGAMDDRAAKKAIETSDRERAKYFERFYNVRSELPTHYDLTINTDAVEPPQAAQVILQAARA